MSDLQEIVKRAQQTLIEIGVLVSDMTRDEREQCDATLTRACEEYMLARCVVFMEVSDKREQEIQHLRQKLSLSEKVNYELNILTTRQQADTKRLDWLESDSSALFRQNHKVFYRKMIDEAKGGK